MCGIAGLLDGAFRGDAPRLKAVASAMADRLVHRGPDAAGIWTDEARGLAFGHTRLSIIDLSPAGAQPMESRCGRCVIAYNGEVYNAAELRAELEAAGRWFRGRSDTEAVVEACAEWGVEATAKRLIGMFAFALWDRKDEALVLVRDRLGIKPLYWGGDGARFHFASELKALASVPGWTGVLDRQALAAYLVYGYVPAPSSIYQGVRKLGPGELLILRAGGEPEIRTYWSLAGAVEAGRGNPLDVSDAAAADALEAILQDSVTRRMVSDVPLGVFLSGGIDSSTVAALMQRASPTPVKTFSIGFREAEFDEAGHAKSVARHLGTEHTEFVVTPEEARDVIPILPTIYDEPFADSSQIPTYLVSRLTRRDVTVALSGDGGDELFAGYNRYAQGLNVVKSARVLPARLRSLLASGVLAVPPASWDLLSRALPAGVRPRLPGDKMHKLAGVIAEDGTGFYRKLVSQWDEAWTLVADADAPNRGLYAREARDRLGDDVAWMQYVDLKTYLPDDILAKVDRASMAVGLEVRVPILDHRVVEFAWRLPMRFKIRNGASKWLLRQVLYRHVPRPLVERPKMGFGVPIDAWLRGPLRDWAEGLLAADALAADDLMHPRPIREKWDEHLSGRRNWQHFLWNVLMFQAWRQEWRPTVPPVASLDNPAMATQGA